VAARAARGEDRLDVARVIDVGPTRRDERQQDHWDHRLALSPWAKKIRRWASGTQADYPLSFEVRSINLDLRREDPGFAREAIARRVVLM
jgi:hypothetical protein